MMRVNRAVLAAFLCSAVAPATCDPFDRGTPFQTAQWPTLSETDPAFQRALTASSTTLQTMPDVSLALVAPRDVEKRPLYKTAAEANTLPSTSTSGGVMLLLPRR